MNIIRCPHVLKNGTQSSSNYDMSHKWDYGNGSSLHGPGLYLLMLIESKQIWNIYLLSKAMFLHLKFYVSIYNVYFCYERLWKNDIDCGVLKDVVFFQRCLNRFPTFPEFSDNKSRHLWIMFLLLVCVLSTIVGPP